jgi:hypothetical protein
VSNEREKVIAEIAKAWTRAPFPSTRSITSATRVLDLLDNELDYISPDWVAGLDALRRSRDRAEAAVVELAEGVIARGHYDTCGASLTEQLGDCNCPYARAVEMEETYA